jgi:hypothetical protein
MSQRASYEKVSAISSDLLYKSWSLQDDLTRNAEDRTSDQFGRATSEQAATQARDWYRTNLAEALRPLGWTLEELDAADERAQEEFYASLDSETVPVPEHDIVFIDDDGEEPEDVDL